MAMKRAMASMTSNRASRRQDFPGMALDGPAGVGRVVREALRAAELMIAS
jgi:MinD superfamily P-loop ATPase